MAARSGHTLHVPPERSPSEEAHWWDDHADELDWEEGESEVVRLGPVERTAPVALRLPIWILEALRREAAKSNVSSHWLMSTWLEERLASWAPTGVSDTLDIDAADAAAGGRGENEHTVGDGTVETYWSAEARYDEAIARTLCEEGGPMVAVPQEIIGRRLTLEDYGKLPDDQDYEIIDGVLHVSPRARPKHQKIASEFLFLLMIEQKRGVGTVVPDADLIVDDRNTYVSPDLMFFAGSRFAAVNPNEMLRIIPDLVVEVLSPSTGDYDRTTKRDLYERLGVRHYWTVDGDRRALVEHVLQADGTYRERTVRAPEVFRPELFPDLEINLTQVLA